MEAIRVEHIAASLFVKNKNNWWVGLKIIQMITNVNDKINF